MRINGFNPINIAICHGCFKVIRRSQGRARKCSHCGATHFSWLEPKSPADAEDCRARAELRIRADFAGMDDAGRMAFVKS